MPLNYNKWDQLELSDDSDIEGHPNVDKKSLIRWKQRDIHEKREARKAKIDHIRAQIACNNVLYPRIQAIQASLESGPDGDKPRTVYFSSLVEQLERNPSKECPPGNNPDELEQTYDGMLLSLLRQVGDAAKVAVKEAGVSDDQREEKIGKALTEGMKEHVVRLKETIDNDSKELEQELNEQKKHITSDDMHDGFANKYVPPKPEPAPLPIAAKLDKPSKPKAKTTEFEVINAPRGQPAAEEAEEDAEDDDDIANLTPSLEAFSKIPLKGFEQSFRFIQEHRDVVVPGASDALLGAAFKAQYDNKPKYAKKCVHQSLLLQYGDKLGANGLGVFFKKMIAGDKRAEAVFLDDVEKTYAHLAARVKLSQEEAKKGGRETIMLASENEGDITFNVPSGPPPDELVLGEGMEDMDIEEVRRALQLRWDIFQTLPENLRTALQTEELVEVNKVLGDMEVAEAEEILQRLDMAGIIPFSESGVRDETPAGRAAAGLPPA
ncbi:Cdc37 N terminal kinase binding-domain-containing protein [Mycena albidolilacea]|uniref:Hsp90 chaperone protein kinase-targeting subunit n=1 Tax=Mycena albidolilacea TaxID=1033008 RepID=A0AAD7AS51_9AGAR|nr:Cdc37 N terminal kinase binding-domain-containing protein [Mycena albidolilacea]